MYIFSNTNTRSGNSFNFSHQGTIFTSMLSRIYFFMRYFSLKSVREFSGKGEKKAQVSFPP